MTTTASTAQGVERHASWTELFFDLVAVAGIAALAHVLEGELDAVALGLYALLFLAFWLSWTTFMMYGNVAAGRTHVLRLLVGMVGLGALAASVPGVADAVLHDGDGRPLDVFAVAYVATRVYGAQSWRRGDVVVDFPIVQYTAGLLPWLVSVWVDEPWKLALWALGAVVDLLLVVVVSGDRLLGRLTTTRDPARAARRRTVRGLSVDPVHLGERLGLFVIIVLGESVVQVIHATSGAPYDARLLVTGLACFVLLAGLFGLSVVHGHAGVPHLPPGRLPVRAALGLHCLVTGVIATIAVSLSAVVTLGDHALPGPGRWLLCAAVAAYFTLGVVSGVAGRSADWRRSVSRVVTGVVAPLLLGVFATGLAGDTVVAILAVIVLAHLWYERRLPPITA